MFYLCRYLLSVGMSLSQLQDLSYLSQTKEENSDYLECLGWVTNEIILQVILLLLTQTAKKINDLESSKSLIFKEMLFKLQGFQILSGELHL